MAAPTNSALRRPMAMNSTATTRITPVPMLFSRSATMMRMSLDWSARKVALIPAGQPARDWSTAALMASVTAMMLAPERFCTDSETESWPSIRE